jgi:hypothetical protein
MPEPTVLMPCQATTAPEATTTFAASLTLADDDNRYRQDRPCAQPYALALQTAQQERHTVALPAAGAAT